MHSSPAGEQAYIHSHAGGAGSCACKDPVLLHTRACTICSKTAQRGKRVGQLSLTVCVLTHSAFMSLWEGKGCVTHSPLHIAFSVVVIRTALDADRHVDAMVVLEQGTRTHTHTHTHTGEGLISPTRTLSRARKWPGKADTFKHSCTLSTHHVKAIAQDCNVFLRLGRVASQRHQGAASATLIVYLIGLLLWGDGQRLVVACLGVGTEDG